VARQKRRAPTLVLDGGHGPPAAGWLIVAPGTADERRVKIGDEPLCLGSDEEADIRIDDPHVSRKHCEVRLTVDGVLLRDLGSKNGTFLADTAVQSVLLRSGALITLGRTLIRFEAERGRSGSAPPTVSQAFPDGPTRLGDAIGVSPAMRRVFAMLERVAPSELTVTLTGETGTGKDVLARAVHQLSARSAGPFVVFDCGAVAPSLIESELFGHEKGAFTGAVSERRGAFERAHGGTLFLDEVGELQLDLQPKLLRVLESRQVRRVGGAVDTPVDVRIIAATNRELEDEVKTGRFREDLFFRLSGIMVAVPPLRERREDLHELATLFLREAGSTMTLAHETLDILASYDWPGNVRELRNVLGGAAALADGPVLEPRHLIFFKPRRRDPTIDKLPLAGRSLETIERAAIVQTLRQYDGNKTKAARALGIAASTLYEKIKKYSLGDES
jgi:transcriptional regulator with PAS, ATPase and Fis domain